MPEVIKNIIASLAIAVVLIFFAVLTYFIFGQIAEHNYREAKEDCKSYYKVEGGQQDAEANLDRCLKDAQNTRRTTNRIGTGAGLILAIIAFGFALWGLKELRGVILTSSG